MQKILNYSRSRVGDYDGVAQQRPWDCGPATAQIILQAAGINKTEDWLISAIGTTEAGTNHSGLIAKVLDDLLPGSGYGKGTVWLVKDPPTAAQVNKLWADITRSIDANRGVVLNFEAPPWNFPKGSNGSTSPEYRGNSTIYHYVGGLGVAVDDSGGRHVWIADPGFRPFGYFITLEQCARLITPHAYAYAATAPVQAQPKIDPKPQPVDRGLQLWWEWTATQYGDRDSIGQLVKAAKAGDPQSTRALALLEKVNPAALQSYITVTKGQ